MLLLVFLTLALACASISQAATNAVLFSLGDFTTSPVQFKQMKVAPMRSSFPRAEGDQVVGIDPIYKLTDSSGQSTLILSTGDYEISFTNRFTVSVFKITTPSTNYSGTLNAKDLTSNGTNSPSNLNSYSMTQSDARYVARSLGFATNLSITATSTPSPSAGQVLTYGPNGVSVWSNAPAVGGISVAQGTNVILTTNGSVITINATGTGGGGSGDVTTSQLNTASNVLNSRIVANDTTTSNGLYSLISGGGITAGIATNIAENFATNSAFVTSNTLYSLITTNPVVFHPGSLLVSNTVQVGSDVIGERVSSGVLGLRNNNTPQGIFLYRYSTNDNADTEYGFMNWFSTEFQVGVNKSGVGQNRSLGLAVSGSTRWRLGTDSSFAPTAVYKLGSSTLPIGDITSIGVVNASNVVVAGGSTTRVGVGTTNPAVELDLYGAMRYESLTASRLLGLNAQKDATNITLDASLTLSGDTLSVTVATNPVVFGPGIVVATNGYAIGGTSSSHTYLRRNGTQLLVRLGDDSAYAPAMASYWSSHNGGGEKSSLGAGGTGNLWTGSDGRLIWSSATSLSSGTGTADVGFYRYGVGTNGVGTSSTTPAGSLIFSNLHLLGRMTIPGNGASSNYVWTCTNSATGEGEWRVNPGAGGGEANVNGETSVTNATRIGLVAGKSGVTNLLRSIEPGYGLTITNQGTNVVPAVDASIIASVAWANSISNLAASKQSGSFLLSNLLAMGISNIVAGTNMHIQTNSGALVLNSTASGGGGGVSPGGEMEALMTLNGSTEWVDLGTGMYIDDSLQFGQSIFGGRDFGTGAGNRSFGQTYNPSGLYGSFNWFTCLTSNNQYAALRYGATSSTIGSAAASTWSNRFNASANVIVQGGGNTSTNIWIMFGATSERFDQGLTTDGVKWEAKPAGNAAATWYAGCGIGSTWTYVTSTIPVTNYLVKLSMRGDYQGVAFFTNGVWFAGISNNLPTNRIYSFGVRQIGVGSPATPATNQVLSFWRNIKAIIQ